MPKINKTLAKPEYEKYRSLIKMINPHVCICGGQLSLVQAQTSFKDINPITGTPEDLSTNVFDSEYLFCNKCGKRYYDTTFFINLNNETEYTIAPLQTMEDIIEKRKELMDKSKYSIIDDNPFYK